MTALLLAGLLNIVMALFNWSTARRNKQVADTNLELAKANLANSRRILALVSAAGTESSYLEFPAQPVTKD